MVLPDRCCVWAENEDGVWETECGHVFTFETGTATENSFRYCPYCGRTLISCPLRTED